MRGTPTTLSTCSDDYEKNGALCYPKCKEGFYGVGPICWELCKEGYDDHGVSCFKNALIYTKECCCTIFILNCLKNKQYKFGLNFHIKLKLFYLRSN